MFDFIKYLWTSNNPWQRVGCIILALCVLFVIGLVLFMFILVPEVFIFIGSILAVFGSVAALFYFSEKWENFKRRTRKW